MSETIHGPVTGTVYFIADAALVKIGFTRGDPAKRLAYLQTGNPRPLELLAAVPGCFDMERELHQYLAGDRIAGEWFNADAPAVRSILREVGHG